MSAHVNLVQNVRSSSPAHLIVLLVPFTMICMRSLFILSVNPAHWLLGPEHRQDEEKSCNRITVGQLLRIAFLSGIYNVTYSLDSFTIFYIQQKCPQFYFPSCYKVNFISLSILLPNPV